MLGSFFSILAGAGYFFGKCLNEAADRDLFEINYVKSGMKERSRLYHIMTGGNVLPYEKRELAKRAGRWPSRSLREDGTYDDTNFEVAVRQIALKEGWSYNPDGSVYGFRYPKGSEYARYLGPEWKDRGICSYDEIAKAMNEETERREAWRERCPRSDEVDVYPMNFPFDDEDGYRKAVKKALTDRWYKKYRYSDLPHGLNAYDYEDEEDFLKDKEKFDNYYSRYNIYKEAPEDRREAISSYIYDIENLLSSYDLKNITPKDIDKLFRLVRKEFKYLKRFEIPYRVLEEKLTMLGYGEYFEERRRQEAASAPPSPKDLVFSSENPALPSPTSQEPSSITQSTKEQTPPNTKTNSNVHITATGKTYTMRRGNKKSKLTLTKKV